MINPSTRNCSEWPECPRCHQKREARCTSCQARGTDFRLADPVEVDEGGEIETEILLLCSLCDEPFTPQFNRSCVECGFDFGDGIQPTEFAREELNNRAVLVMVAMALLLAGLLGFFAFVLRAADV